MKNIQIKDNFAFIYLNKNFYKKNIILKTLNLYKDFFEFLVLESKTHNIIKITKTTNDYTLQTLSNEFTNYLISEEYEKIKL